MAKPKRSVKIDPKSLPPELREFARQLAKVIAAQLKQEQAQATQ